MTIRHIMAAVILIFSGASASLQAQDLRSQCTVQNATDVLRRIFAPEVAGSPVWAQVLADPNAEPVKAAINDCQAGREGGGRAGMERWISIAQNRQFYVQVLIQPALIQSPLLRRQIESSYQEALGRLPTPGEIEFWVKDARSLQPTALLEAHRQWLRAGNEMQQTISRSYQEAFKRAPSAGELAHWQAQISQHGLIYRDVMGLHRQFIAQNPSVLNPVPVAPPSPPAVAAQPAPAPVVAPTPNPVARPAPAPAPAPAPPPATPAACAQGFYVFDGTNNGSHQSTIMYHLYQWARNAPGCTLVKRYYAGIGDASGLGGLATAAGIDRMWADAVADLCQDIAGRTQGQPLVSIGMAGFSRGAMVAVSVANHLAKSGCNVGGRHHAVAGKIQFLGLSDAVRTSLAANWPDHLETPVGYKIHLIKTQYESADPQRLALWTHRVGNIWTEELRDMEHVDMNCFRKQVKVGGVLGLGASIEVRDVPNARIVEQHLVDNAQRAGFHFVEPRRRSGVCPVDDPGAVERFIQMLPTSSTPAQRRR